VPKQQFERIIDNRRTLTKTQVLQLVGGGGGQYVLLSDYDAADVLVKLLTVDGAGSGLDADLLDGLHATDYIPKSLVDAAGDILVGTADNTPGRLAISATNGHVLTVVTGALAWAAPASVAPTAHATTHKNGGTDELLLSDFGEPTASVAFDGQQATNLVVHTVADATARVSLTPVVGKLVFQTDELALYLCTVAA
jgi:hypothetical protein